MNTTKGYRTFERLVAETATKPFHSLMKNFFNILACITVLWSAGCATRHSTAEADNSGTKVIYRLTEAQALNLVSTSLATSFPRQDITPIERPVKGFKVYTRVVFDKWTSIVLAVPVTGTTPEGQKVEGYRFDISGAGTTLVGRMRARKFRQRFLDDLAQSNTAVPVQAVGPRL